MTNTPAVGLVLSPIPFRLPIPGDPRQTQSQPLVPSNAPAAESQPLDTHSAGVWLLLIALASETRRPLRGWTAAHYRAILADLADLHASRWDRISDSAGEHHAWVFSPDNLARDTQVAREAFLHIEQASWGGRFFPAARLRAWLRVLDDPRALLDLLVSMPQTVILGGLLPSTGSPYLQESVAFDRRPLAVGPAPYDLAGLYASSRRLHGHAPLSLTEMRNHYLDRLGDRLGHTPDRYLFDAAIDAARAWQFLIHWPAAIAEHHTCFLASLHHLRITVLEPAYAALRRADA